MTKNNHISHLLYFMSQAVMLGVGLLLILSSSYDSQIQILAIFLTTFFYVFLGILHHGVHHNLTARIMVEYILFGALGLTCILLILRGGLL